MLRPFAVLDDLRLQQTFIYLNLLLKWNARINLTSVRSPEEIVTRHFGESFFVAAQVLAPDESISVVDLGSGAGFPGMPMAISAQHARVTLIESNSKKAAFLSEVARTLKLGNAAVFHGRGEDYRRQADLVTMRAVEKFDASLPLAFSLVAPKGRLALMIGQSQVSKAKELAPGLEWKEPITIPGGHSRVLLIGHAE
jgi:16S rRNA (guanine527-N7)-methyltransferase